MALWSRVKLLPWVLTRACCSRNLSQVEGRAYPAGPSATHQVQSSDKNCIVDLGVMHDGSVVGFHNVTDISYDMTKPIPTQYSPSDPTETHDLVLKSQLTKEVLKNKLAPTVEELSKMFYTTKHCWYPLGQYHIRRRKKNPPKDR